MAGIGFLGHTLTHNSVSITHMTSFNLNVQGGTISQIVADQASALTLSQPVVKSITVSFAVPSSGAHTLLEAYENGTAGETVLTLKDGVGGSTIAVWTSSDSLGEAQGVSVSGSGGAFVIATTTVNVNGGTWTAT